MRTRQPVIKQRMVPEMHEHDIRRLHEAVELSGRWLIVKRDARRPELLLRPIICIIQRRNHMAARRIFQHPRSEHSPQPAAEMRRDMENQGMINL